ncbi:MAG: metallophosphoesterase family protein [Bacillota bacterium]|nr:metallophosphoesterase family protein [Bacillota bacterium]
MTAQYFTVEYDETIKTIGVVSDTHVPNRARFLPPELFRVLDGVDLILHCGDLVKAEIIEELEAIAPVEAVSGNMDPPELKNKLGRLKLLKIGGMTIGLLHGDITGRQVPFNEVASLFAPHALQAVVFGHIHEPVNREFDGILFFNPGSAVDPRHGFSPSCGLLSITGKKISGRIIFF